MPARIPRWRLLAAAILLFFPAASYGAPLPYNSDYAVVKTLLATPQAVAEYLSAHFSYAFHDGRLAYAPADFNTRRGGDCKDYSAFFSDVVASHGFSVTQYAFRYDAATGYGHVVSIFTDTDGKQYVATHKNGDLAIYGPITSLAEAGQACIANGVLPAGSIADQWLAYPAGLAGNMYDTGGFSYFADYAQAMSQLNYFQHVAQYMTACFTRAAHPGAFAFSPAELNTRLAGDAKDFAVFAAAYLSDRHFNPTLHAFRYDPATNAHHVVTVFQYGGKYYFQSYQYLFGPLDAFSEIEALCKASGHIPADSQVDGWTSYPAGFTGPFPGPFSLAGPLQLLFEE
ncbi:hypothetical protein G3N56_17975 [Desulfovibrio sulfodismutans]|uniref:Transglutaminase domain-containing protein n=1 Tax=Desulfolutivibrio sulfodismutans TaxID=63561 RepID=A0A7K3NR87_9BACT|nr:hypothetical protein [Desulfolutivibrio sulfodismutans]NDY58627.1 hypothetical protein [Desulfolutivibrio sulfodismutans]QLA12478.1 hypothetical protein GD606_09430 [Desulfolutivibrio sulfodismutans DSM 3696]